MCVNGSICIHDNGLCFIWACVEICYNLLQMNSCVVHSHRRISQDEHQSVCVSNLGECSGLVSMFSLQSLHEDHLRVGRLCTVDGFDLGWPLHLGIWTPTVGGCEQHILKPLSLFKSYLSRKPGDVTWLVSVLVNDSWRKTSTKFLGNSVCRFQKMFLETNT